MLAESAWALLARNGPKGESEYLICWDTASQAYTLPGGRLQSYETLRQCCAREIARALQRDAGEFEVSPFPHAGLRFQEYSTTAQAEMEHHWQAFDVRWNAAQQQLPDGCAWLPERLIRLDHAADGRPLADDLKRVMQAVESAEFDLFVSYARADNRNGSVAAFIEHIRREHEEFDSTEPLRIFFDVWGIENGHEWERRIYKGLIESKALLAVLSPKYFASEWCQREYETFASEELKRLYPGEHILSIYIKKHADFETNNDHPKREWYRDIQKRQFLDATRPKAWWRYGQQAFQREPVARRLNELRQSIWNRIRDARALRHSPTNLTAFNANFVGRARELTEISKTLQLDSAAAISAIQGIGGLGKTALARAYAHFRRRDYPGGQFEIAMENVASHFGLQIEFVRLANLYLNARIPDELTNTRLAVAFACARAAFERPGQGRILLILDNVVHNEILSLRASWLPAPEHVHVLATTRLDSEMWGVPTLRLEALSTGDALDLFAKYRPFNVPADAKRWHRVRIDAESLPENDADEEWKAAVGIINRLGRHALAVEVVAVYLKNHRSIGLRDYLSGLIQKGLSLKLSQAGDDPAVRALLSTAIETDIRRLLEPTFARIEQEAPLALRALEWAALMPPDHVPLSWLRSLLERECPDAFQHDSDEPDPWEDGVEKRLVGWRLLTREDGALTARMHRISQTAVLNRGSSASGSNGAGRPSAVSLMPFLESRAEILTRDLEKVGANWELTPLLEFAQHWLPALGVRIGTFVDRLIRTLAWDGRIRAALGLQHQMVLLEEARHAGAPGNPDFAASLANAYGNLGDLWRDLGKRLLARDFYERTLALREQLAAEAPDNPDYAHKLAESYSSQGDLWRALGDGLLARESYDKALAIGKWLTTDWPENDDFAIALSIAYNKLGDLSRALGKIIEARDFYDESLAIREQLALEAPDNLVYARKLSVSYLRLGDVWRLLGNDLQALEFYEESRSISERLLAEAPKSAACARNLAFSNDRLGDLSRALGNRVRAREHYEKALAFRERLVADASENADYARDLAFSCNQLGDLWFELGSAGQARALYERALAIRESLAAAAPENADYACDLAASCSRIARCLESDDGAAAFAWRRRGRDIMQKLSDGGQIVAQVDLELFQQLNETLKGD